MTPRKTISFENYTTWTEYQEFFSTLYRLTYREKFKHSFPFIIDELVEKGLSVPELCQEAIWFEETTFEYMKNLKGSLFEEEACEFVESKMKTILGRWDESWNEGYFWQTNASYYANTILPKLWKLSCADTADIKKLACFLDEDEFYYGCNDMRDAIVASMLEKFKTLPIVDQVHRTLRKRIKRITKSFNVYPYAVPKIDYK